MILRTIFTFKRKVSLKGAVCKNWPPVEFKTKLAQLTVQLAAWTGMLGDMVSMFTLLVQELWTRTGWVSTLMSLDFIMT